MSADNPKLSEGEIKFLRITAEFMSNPKMSSTEYRDLTDDLPIPKTVEIDWDEIREQQKNRE
jgi:hypothetical protein